MKSKTSAMECPLCCTLLKQHLLQPNVSIIACPSVTCVYPFNLSISELHQQNLLLTDVKPSNIMANMESKMVEEIQIDPKIAKFISKEDNDIF